jgi:putative oxidoreductase
MTELFLLGRIVFGGFFIYNGIHHFTDVSMMAPFVASKGVPMAETAVIGSGLLLIVGGAAVLLGIWTRIGIACLAIFLIGVTPVMHNFWTIADPMQRMGEMGNFMKNVALLGGALALAGVPEPWPYSVRMRRRIPA